MADYRYVFLIGAARSGTKFLRDTIALSADVAAVPYDVNYVWRHGNENCPHDELQPDDVDQRTADYIRKSITRLALKNRDSKPKVILEKTVSNTLRVETIRRVFPEAEFIRLERPGLDVVESSYRQWTQPTDRSYLLEKLRYFPVREWRYALWFAKNALTERQTAPIWGPRYSGIETDLERLGVAQTCAVQWKRSVELSREQGKKSDTIDVRYSTLGLDLTRALQQLEVSDADKVSSSFSESFSTVRSWPGEVPSVDQQACLEIVQTVVPEP